MSGILNGIVDGCSSGFVAITESLVRETASYVPNLLLREMVSIALGSVAYFSIQASKSLQVNSMVSDRCKKKYKK